jgi:hypothetical protein
VHVGPVGHAAGLSGLHAGAARVDLTPLLGLALAGHSAQSGHAQGVWGRLFASVLVLDDGKAERVALIATDLHTGTRYLAEKLAAAVAGATGLRVDRLFLAASHTHRGPGHLYGNRVYDSIVSTPLGAGLDLATADDIAAALAVGVRDACARLRPARVGYGAFAAWGLAWNRSYLAARRNVPGIDPPDEEALVREASRRLNGGEAPPDPLPWPAPAAAPPPAHHAASAAAGDPDAGVLAHLPAAEPAGGDDFDAAVAAAEPDRTLAALRAAPAPAAAPAPGASWAGADAPVEHSRLERLLVDTRVHCVWAEEPSGKPIGAFATFGATPALVSRLETLYSADVFGEAVRVAEETLHGRFSAGAPAAAAAAYADGATLTQARGGRVVLGLAGGALGDSNVVVPDRTIDDVLKRRREGRLDGCLEVARSAAARLGQALVEACLRARAALADDLTIALRWAEPNLRGAAASPAPGDVLARHARFGPSALAGSEFNVGPSLAREGITGAFHASDPHSPKPHLGIPLPGAQRSAPLRVVRLVPGPTAPPPGAVPGGPPADVALVAVPAEPTAFAALDVAVALRTALARPALAVMVSGPAGDYLSYFTTEAEHAAQHYEGASMIWGRRTGAWLANECARLAAGPPAPPPAGVATFDSASPRHLALASLAFPTVPLTTELREPTLRDTATQNGAAFHALRPGDPATVLLFGAWRCALDANPPLHAGAFMVVEEILAGGAVAPLVHHAARVDDRNFGVLLVREPHVHGAIWLWSLRIRDAGAWRGRRLRFRVIGPAPVQPPGPVVWPTAVVP